MCGVVSRSLDGTRKLWNDFYGKINNSGRNAGQEVIIVTILKEQNNNIFDLSKRKQTNKKTSQYFKTAKKHSEDVCEKSQQSLFRYVLGHIMIYHVLEQFIRFNWFTTH